MKVLILATRNRHKVQEIRAVLSDAFAYRTLNDFPEAPTVVEDAGTFAGNASKKAVELARWIRNTPAAWNALASAGPAPDLFCLADDSGLEVDVLGGAPGVHSARFAALDNGSAENSSDPANNSKLLGLLARVPPENRTARFRCVIAVTPVPPPMEQTASPVCSADEAELGTELFEGTCEGRIVNTPRGTHGFGYDPLFIPEGYSESFAELGEEQKNRISHRAKALQKLRERLDRTTGRGVANR